MTALVHCSDVSVAVVARQVRVLLQGKDSAGFRGSWEAVEEAYCPIAGVGARAVVAVEFRPRLHPLLLHLPCLPPVFHPRDDT